MGTATSTNLETVRQIAAANSSPPVEEAAPQPEVKRTKRSKAGELPIEFYNSRFPHEQIFDPVDANKRAGIRTGDVGRYIQFNYGYFNAQEQWQVDLLRKLPYVFEADLDEVEICDACGYGTKSLKDYRRHVSTHF